MSKSSSTAKDLTAGTVGGIAQVLVGQPFDIVKVVRTPSSLSVSRFTARLTRFPNFQRDRELSTPKKNLAVTIIILEDANCSTGKIQWHGTMCWRYLQG